MSTDTDTDDLQLVKKQPAADSIQAMLIVPKSYKKQAFIMLRMRKGFAGKYVSVRYLFYSLQLYTCK